MDRPPGPRADPQNLGHADLRGAHVCGLSIDLHLGHAADGPDQGGQGLATGRSAGIVATRSSNQPVGRWGFGRRRQRVGILTADRRPLRFHCRSRRLRLHGPCSFSHGQAHVALRPEREILYSHAIVGGLRRAGDYGHSRH